MSCDVVGFAVSLCLASTSVSAVPPGSAAVAAPPPPSVASEPLFADIVRRARLLRSQTKAYENGALGAGAAQLAGFSGFQTEVSQLAALDMQGHVVLVKRGVSDDLKCILKGISQDLPVKLKALEAAPTAKARHAALDDMFYLLRDNVQVITAPPQPSA
ncbi:MAG TPA: hypothetical protein VMU93_15840 [Caulobacteraceae bacterium]|nr:hypothetical protein [Caulobacteraceae bacterium]